MKRLAICVLVSCLVFCSQASGQSGIITTVAGNGTDGFYGDGGPATSASLNSPYEVVVDASGNLFITDNGNNRIRKVSTGGVITTVAGGGPLGYFGDGGPATSAALNNPQGVAVDASGNLFIADSENYVIRKVSASGIISYVAGNGSGGFSGDGGRATSASLSYPQGVVVDAYGNLFIADTGNNRIRKVSTSGIITTVAGSGGPGFSSSGNFSGDGGPATSAALNYPHGVTVDASGSLFIADTGNMRIRQVSVSGVITTVAGTGSGSFSGPYSLAYLAGDGGPATSAALSSEAVAVDASGNLFVADAYNNRIRKVSTSGIITTVAGSGGVGENSGSFSGDGGPATSASLSSPWGVAVDAFGNLFIADTYNNRIREVSASGGPASQTITFGALSNVTLGVAPFAISATASSGLAVSFASITPAVCTVSGGTTTILAVGLCSIMASQTGDASFSAAYVTEDFTVNAPGPASQTITFGMLSSLTLGVAPFTINATASSGLLVAFASTTLSVCTVSGTMVAIVAAGTCSITASQTGNASYLAATSVAQGFAVTLAANGGGVITTVAGNGISLPFPYTPDYGGPATSTWLSAPQGVAVDASGNLSLRTPWVSRRCRPAASSVHSRATL